MRSTLLLAVILIVAVVALALKGNHEVAATRYDRPTRSAGASDVRSRGEGAKAATTVATGPERSAGDCADKYLGGRMPAVPAAQTRDAVTLCYRAFATLSSPATRTPLWAAEALTPGTMTEAGRTERVSEFHAEGSLRRDARAELSDYRRSGYDRGHLAPSADMPGYEAQQESFTLANIVPQSGDLNRGSWADLEGDVRSLARRRDVVYVVTGVLFQGPVRRTPSGRVAVPTAMWKAIASPGEGAAVLVASNDDEPVWRTDTVDAFTGKTGIDPFPALDAVDRDRLLRIGGR